MKSTVSIGKIEDVEIPADLPYAGALKQLVKDATGTGVTVNIDSFYTNEPIELHNFVDTITYRFVNDGDGDEEFLAYCVCSRPMEIYREVKFDGTICVSNATDIEVSNTAISTEQISVRMKKFLSIG